VSRCTSSVVSAPESALTAWTQRVFQSRAVASTSPVVPSGLHPPPTANDGGRVVSLGATRSHRAAPVGRLTNATRPAVCASPTLVRTRRSSVYPLAVTYCGTSVCRAPCAVVEVNTSRARPFGETLIRSTRSGGIR
jgi:hypothetical protein